MHRRSIASPFLRCARANGRYVATAVKSKPRDWSLDSDSKPAHVPPQLPIAGSQSLQLDKTPCTSPGASVHYRGGPQGGDDVTDVRHVAREQRKYGSLNGQDNHGAPHRSSREGGPRSLTRRLKVDALDKWTLPSKTVSGGHNHSTKSNAFAAESTASSQSASITETEAELSSKNASREEQDRQKQVDRPLFKERGSFLSSTSLDRRRDSQIKFKNIDARRSQINAKRKKNSKAEFPQVDLYIPTTVTVANLARLLNVRPERLQRQMRLAGIAEDAAHDYVLSADYAALLAEEFGKNPVVSDEATYDIYPSPPHPNPVSLPHRPPVVAIMGHVDHGKTTLLDALRSTSVAKGEAGGITQHIGAFSIPVRGESHSFITFLDTPGHAAFSAMRARGARATDIIVLVVAADDGIMPQTREVIDLIKREEGKVAVVVAINKIDKPGADIDGVQKALLAEGLQLESFGGDIPCVAVSGLTSQGLTELVETISAMAEMQDLRAEHNGLAHGYVLESEVQKGLGPVATVLVLRGCLKIGSHIISGVSQAKVRLMKDATGSSVKAAYPGLAVTVSGWRTLPTTGHEVLQGNEAEVKKAVANRERRLQLDAVLSEVDTINENKRQEKDRQTVTTASESPKHECEELKELRLIVKADVSGSVEAIVGALQQIGNDKASVKVVFSGVGDLSEADVMMAKTIGGTIIGFSVATPRAVQTLATRGGVPICMSDVIYRLVDDVRQKVIDLLPVSIETAVTGEATVLQLFEIQVKAKQTKKVAGCRVINGLVEKAQLARIVRDGSVIHEGHLETMRQLKRDVTEVRKGSECGLSFADFPDLRQGDLIQMFKRIEKKGVL